MEDQYKYLKFGIMPHTHPDVVSPYTPMSLNKKLYQITFSSGPISIGTSSTLEGVVLEPYTAVVNEQAAIALCYAVNPPSTGTYLAKYGGPKTLSNVPGYTKGHRYIGGYLKITPVSGPSVNFLGRCYEPQIPTTSTSWSTINSTASPTSVFTNIAGPVYISCIPQDLAYRNLTGETYGYFVRSCYHFKVENASPTTSSTINIQGSWWVETYEPELNTVTYVQDYHCPYKMAEYIFGNMRSSYMFVEEANKNTLYTGLTTAIDAALSSVTNSWEMLTSDITITGGSPDPDPEPEPEPTSDEEWAARPIVWNP